MSREAVFPGGFRLIQREGCLRLGQDTVLLSHFTKIRPRSRVCDLGCGSGALSLLLATRHESITLDAVELVPEAAALARENAELSGFSGRISVFEADLRELSGVLSPGAYDSVVTNPPYFSDNSGALPKSPALADARHERACTIEDICRAAERLLRWGGTFSLCFRPERLCDLMCAMRASGLEPKRLRFVRHSAEKPPSAVLAEGKKGGRPGIKTEPPLLVEGQDGSFTEEYLRIYGKDG